MEVVRPTDTPARPAARRTAVPWTRLWVRRALGSLLGLALLQVVAGPAPRAAVPNWPDEPYRVDIVEQAVVDVLRGFASALGISIQLSEGVGGTVRGRLPALAPLEFLDLVSQIYGLVWYFDGATLYVYSLEEVDGRFVDLGAVSADLLLNSLQELDIYDDRFPLRRSDVLGAVFVTGPPRYLDLVQETAALLGLRGPPLDAIDVRVFHLKNATADDRVLLVRGNPIDIPGVASILQRVLSDDTSPLGGLFAGGATRVGRGGNTSRVLSSPGASGRLRETRRLEQARRFEGVGEQVVVENVTVQQPSEEQLDLGPVIQADSRLNAVVIRDIASRMPIYARLIEELDEPTLLVEIEVLIADVVTDRLNELGVNWRAGNGNLSVGVGDGLQQAITGGLTLTSVITGGAIDFVASLQALESVGDARTLSRPNVLTFDHQQAVFDQSQTFFVRVEGDEAAELVEVEFGTLLLVTPHIVEEGNDERVQLIVDVTDGGRLPESQDVDEIPSVRNTQVSTQAMVENGQSLVIGGFYFDNDTDNIEKVPFLGDIPIIGKLFFQLGREERQTVARIFLIRPNIVRVTGDSIATAEATASGIPVIVAPEPPVPSPAKPPAGAPLPREEGAPPIPLLRNETGAGGRPATGACAVGALC